MTLRLSDIPTGDPTLRRWWADTKRALEQEFDRLSRQNLLPIYASTALPTKEGKPLWIAVSTGTALVPAYRDGTNWRHWGTGTATF